MVTYCTPHLSDHWVSFLSLVRCLCNTDKEKGLLLVAMAFFWSFPYSASFAIPPVLFWSFLWSASLRETACRSASRYPRLVSAGRRRCLFVSFEPSQANFAGLCALRAPCLYIGFGQAVSLQYACGITIYTHFTTRGFEQIKNPLDRLNL